MSRLPLIAFMSCTDDTSSTPTVMLSGNAYGFNSARPVEGAVVSIVEHPELATTTAADGTWSLAVPDGGEVTPLVTHPSYVTMQLETFTMAGADLEHVNLQMVTPTIYTLLAQIIDITPDDSKCQIASTVSEKAIQALTFEEFMAHGAHGVAGATVTTTPESVPVVYFNEEVQPDTSLSETTRDGGVVWANVPPGRYTIHATHATKQFADMVIDWYPLHEPRLAAGLV